jgi:hypothetical protein
MDTKATVQSLMEAVQMGNFEKAKSYLSSDFKFSGPVPQPVSGKEWIDMSANLKDAFPNLDYHFMVESVNGDTAQVSAELSGTHKGTLDLTSMHMGTIPATNKSFTAAHEHGKAKVQNGKVISLTFEPIEGAGLMAILGQLGIEVPAM